MKKRKPLYWILVRIPFWTLLASILLVTLLKWVPIRYTPLMLKRSFQFRKDETYHTQQQWVPLKEVSPKLICAIVACEDGRFCEHKGFDWVEMQKMYAEHKKTGKPIRGCSTLSQQTAKNVFTFGTRTWIRKALESYWTVLIELIWGKRRIMEVYLNVAETGKGMFGLDVASWHYYGFGIRDIGINRSVALVICLPAPLEKSPVQPTDKERKRRIQMITRINNRGFEWESLIP